MISLSENSILTLLAERHGILINIHGATEDNGVLFPVDKLKLWLSDNYNSGPTFMYSSWDVKFSSAEINDFFPHQIDFLRIMPLEDAKILALFTK